MARNLNILTACQRFINNPSTAALESLFGLVCSNPHLALLDFGKVVVRKDYDTMEEVKIISGGGSGHEPAFAGFVGKGMLTAAVQGDIFTSPPANDILKTIRELAGEQNMGVLVIIPNNTGDRMNFGLAVERAQNEGIKTKMLIVSDDTTTITKRVRDKRGLCGTFLIQKIAGAMSQNGCNLEEIYSYCETVQKELYSILLSLKPCTFDKTNCFCKQLVANNEMEIGAGLSGESGPLKMSVTAVEHICKMLFEQLTNENNENKIIFEEDVPIILLVNNLGATSKLEEYIFLKELIVYLHKLGITISRHYCGRFLTSLDMTGFSVTILKVKDPKILELIDMPCGAPCWFNIIPVEISPENENLLMSKVRDTEAIEMRGPRLSKRQSNTLTLVVQFACDALISCERQLNVIDLESGDGDTGTRLRRGVDAINMELSRHSLNLFYPFTFLLSLSKLVENSMGGTLGCIYSILFEAAAKEFMTVPEGDHVGAWLWLYALKRACQSLNTYTQVEEGDNTLYDPLCACAKGIEECLNSNMGDVDAFGCGVMAAEETAQRTKQPSKRYPDPGAHAVGIWMRAVYEGVKLRCE